MGDVSESRPLTLRAPILALLPNGARVRVTGVVPGDDGQNWSRVTYQGRGGYAHSFLLVL